MAATPLRGVGRDEVHPLAVREGPVDGDVDTGLRTLAGDGRTGPVAGVGELPADDLRVARADGDLPVLECGGAGARLLEEGVEAGLVGGEPNVQPADLPVAGLVVPDAHRVLRDRYVERAAQHLRRPVVGEAGRHGLLLVGPAAFAALLGGDGQIAGRDPDEQHDDDRGEPSAADHVPVILRRLPTALGGRGLVRHGRRHYGDPWVVRVVRAACAYRS